MSRSKSARDRHAALVERVIALHKEGVTVAEISLQVFRTEGCVYTILNKAGISLKHGNPRKEEIIKALRTNPDLSYDQLSKILGVTRGTVIGIAHRNGLAKVTQQEAEAHDGQQ